MRKVLTHLLFPFFTILILVTILVVPAYGQGYDTAAGGDSTDTGGSGTQQTFDGSSDKSAANADVSSNDSYGGNNDTFSDYSNYSSSDTSQSFTDFVDATFGLGNEAGIADSPGGPAPLSNQNNTIDQSGATTSLESTDTGYDCSTVNCNAPVVTGTTSCLGSKPVVDLSWTGDATKVSYWHIVRAKEPNPSFSQLGFRQVGTYSYRDQVLIPNDVYYFAVFGSNSGNGGGYSARTPLSDIIAVYTPSCAPQITASCPVMGAPEKFDLTWNNNDPSASGYRLFRGVNGDILTRAFLPPSHAASTGNFTDATVVTGTSYNYWLKSFVTVFHPAYQNVTSTDENGNPTGYEDFPAYYEDIEAPFSGSSIDKTPIICTPPVSPSPSAVTTLPSPSVAPISPTISLFLNEHPSYDIPLVVPINTPVTIRWSVSNATGCIASSNPSQLMWVGPQNPSAGTQLIGTSTEGIFTYTLDCSNDSLNTSVTSQLTVRSANDPFIKTTSGDVHSNSQISVPN